MCVPAFRVISLAASCIIQVPEQSWFDFVMIAGVSAFSDGYPVAHCRAQAMASPVKTKSVGVLLQEQNLQVEATL